MKMLRILPLFVLVTLAFVSCKKDDVTPQPTKTEMLAGGNWKLTSLTVSPAYVVNGISISDVFATYPACLKDDFQTFAADGTYTYDEGATKCDPTAIQTETGTWKFNSNETTVSLTLPTYTDVWEISKLSTSSMTSIFKLTEGGVLYTFTGILQK